VRELSVVIPTLARRTTLPRVLAGLEAAGDPERFEVIVVAEQAGAAAAREAVGERPYATRVLARHGPSVSAARNDGWRAASTPVALFLGDDMIPRPGLVDVHLDRHRAEPAEEVAVLGHVSWARELEVTAFMRWLERGIQFEYETIDGADAGWGRFYTANASAKRVLIERAGGFDEDRYPFAYEDLDLGYRMNEHGMRLRYAPEAEVEHLHPTDVAQWRERMAHVAPAERRFVEQYPEIPAYFHDLFAAAAAMPRARGRGARLASFVPPGLPVLGPRVWRAADLYWRQALAGSFLSAWEAASSGGSEPGGPK
jgi:GT2 family glycosyltransferase